MTETDRTLLARVDHLVYAAPNLDAAVDTVARRLGVPATPGGAHPGRGTRNALIALGPWCYLEIVGPDPEQPAPAAERWFGIDTLSTPRLVTWAVKGTALARFAAESSEKGVHLGPVSIGARTRPDGATFRWACTDPATVVAGGVVPFFIDWGEGDHPAAAVAVAAGVALLGLRAEHPFPDEAQPMLEALGLNLDVEEGPEPALIATLRTASGDVELR